MKKLILACAVSTLALMATDYQSMTIDELVALKGTVPVDERADFQAAMQEKMQSLTPEERAEIISQTKATNSVNTQASVAQKNMHKVQTETQAQKQQRLQDVLGLTTGISSKSSKSIAAGKGAGAGIGAGAGAGVGAGVGAGAGAGAGAGGAGGAGNGGGAGGGGHK